MRTTISIDDDLLSAARQLAARTGRTLSAVLEDALRESLLRSRERPRAPVALPVWTGSATAPGFDAEDPSSWWDFIDESEGRWQLRDERREAG
ncbi:MAG: type II toxin-antitoxin system VapB family antitoxin [Acidimicrobiales bacterium]